MEGARGSRWWKLLILAYRGGLDVLRVGLLLEGVWYYEAWFWVVSVGTPPTTLAELPSTTPVPVGVPAAGGATVSAAGEKPVGATVAPITIGLRLSCRLAGVSYHL